MRDRNSRNHQVQRVGRLGGSRINLRGICGSCPLMRSNTCLLRISSDITGWDFTPAAFHLCLYLIWRIWWMDLGPATLFVLSASFPVTLSYCMAKWWFVTRARRLLGAGGGWGWMVEGSAMQQQHQYQRTKEFSGGYIPLSSQDDDGLARGDGDGGETSSESTLSDMERTFGVHSGPDASDRRSAKLRMVGIITTWVIVTIICGFLMLAWTMISVGLWCAYPREYRRHLCEDAHEVSQLLRDEGVHMSLWLGSLLGLVRHKGMIPWEHDADFGILEEDMPKAIAILMRAKKEFLITRDSSGIVIPLEDSGKYYQRSGEPRIIDIWPIEGNATLFRDSLEEVEYCNGRKFLAPKNRVQIIENYYGKDYMSPQFDHLAPLCMLYVDD